MGSRNHFLDDQPIKILPLNLIAEPNDVNSVSAKDEIFERVGWDEETVVGRTGKLTFSK